MVSVMSMQVLVPLAATGWRSPYIVEGEAARKDELLYDLSPPICLPTPQGGVGIGINACNKWNIVHRAVCD